MAMVLTTPLIKCGNLTNCSLYGTCHIALDSQFMTSLCSFCPNVNAEKGMQNINGNCVKLLKS